MEESTSWRGHSFTLLVFAGIVVLCSVFFVLGMMVGRTQVSVESAGAGAAPAPKDQIAAEVRPEPELQPATAKESKPAAKAPAKAPEKAPEKPRIPDDSVLRPPPPPEARSEPAALAPVTKTQPQVSYYQVSAFKQVKDAEKLVADLKGKGFSALIVSPASGDPNPFYRVQVGPLHTQDEVIDAQVKLQTAGFKPILRK